MERRHEAPRLGAVQRHLCQPVAAHPTRHGASGAQDGAAPPEMDAEVAMMEMQAASQRQMQAVVKLYVRAVDTSYDSPWQKMDAAVSTGSGFAIGDSRILTNAHVVHNAVSVRVQRPGLPGRFEGRVICIARQCDLALVEVADPAFWAELPVVRFAEELPALDSNVSAVGLGLGRVVALYHHRSSTLYQIH